MLEAKKYTFEEVLVEKGYVLYVISGISMLPFLREYLDIIEIHLKPRERCKKYDVVLYKIGDKYILHRILQVRPNDYVICGDHNTQQEYGITDDMILGVMTRVIRDGREIWMDDWRYRLYVHLWCDFFPIRVAILYAKRKAASLLHRISSKRSR